MQNSRLIEILQSLSQPQIKRLKEYYYPPYLKQGSKESRLLNYILDNLDGSSLEKLDRTIVEIAIFSSFKKPKKELAYTTNNLVKALHTFLLVEMYEKEKSSWGQNIKLASYYLEKGNLRSYQAIARKLEKQLRTSQNHDEQYHLWRFKLEELNLKEGKQNRRSQDHLQKCSDALDQYYVENKLRLIVEGLNRSQVIQSQLVPEPIAFSFESIEGSEIEENPGIYFYAELYKLFTQVANDTTYQKLFDDLQTHGAKLAPGYIKAIYEYLLVQCIRFINQGNNTYFAPYLDLTKLFIYNNWILEKGEISPTKFLNIIVIGLKASQIEWTKQFSEQFLPKLPSELRSPFRGLSNALVCFEEEEFQKAINCLNGAEFKDMYYHIVVEKLRLKIYYELSEHDALISRAQSFIRYVQREKKLTPAKTKVLKKFASYLIKLVKHKGYSVEKEEALRRDISSSPEVIERAWLLQKLN